VLTVLALAAGWLRGRRLPGRLLAVAGVTGLIAVLAGPAAYAVTPLAHAIQGSNPLAGPTAGGGPGGFAAPGAAGRSRTSPAAARSPAVAGTAATGHVRADRRAVALVLRSARR
jgi:hypothetical protein